MRIKQQMRLEVKDITVEGSFEGMLSPYNNIDQGNDRVLPGAYTKTLQDQGPTRPLLWQHDPKTPIGQLSLEDRPDGLWCKGQLLMDIPKAKEAYLLIKAGIVKGLSIGFESIKDAIESGVRQLKEVKLYEGSIVTFPMNTQALIQTVKARRELKDDFNEELSDIQLRDAGYQMICALQYALGGIPWTAGLTREQKIAAAEASLQQFADAWMMYLPAYLDWLTEEYGQIETMSQQQILEIKAKEKRTKKVDGVDLTADCFAYVGDPDKTETWALPIKFPRDEEKTKSHIRNALARFNQTDIPESERAKVLAKIKAAAKKYGIDASDDTGKSGRFELKFGARHSAATREQFKDAMDHMDQAMESHKAAYDIMSALYSDEADDDESTSKSAKPDSPITPSTGAAAKSEPVEDHSAAQNIIEEMMAQYRK